MPARGADRKLAAILAADVAGFSRLIGADEEGTLDRLTSIQRELLDPAVANHHGRIFKNTGDGFLAEFASAVDAVRCALDIQSGMAQHESGVGDEGRVEFRIGINVGDVVERDGDILGDGVNIAARLEALAEPGRVLVSHTVHDHARGKHSFHFDELGERSLKNIETPVRVFRVNAGPGSGPGPSVRPVLSLPDRPSIAVLPFQNMSADPDQDYFADGIVEEIITALSRMRWLFVIARNSSFTYKGRAVDVKQVGRELGVRYILEGSVRKAGSKVRITGQLIDASSGKHLWADRFDGELEDIFELQDQVTSSVVGAISPKLEQAEIERAKRKPTESLDAYDFFLRGMAAFHQFKVDSNLNALTLFSQAAELDLDFASAYGMAARCYLQRKGFGWETDRGREIAETIRLARKAADLGQEDAVALCAAGSALVVVVGDFTEGPALISRALVLNPNLAWAWHFSGYAKAFAGEPEVAIEHAARAMRLSPQDPQMAGMQVVTAWGHWFSGRYEEALSWAEAALRQRSNFFVAACVAAASAALAGRVEQAEKAMAYVRQQNPSLCISNLTDLIQFRRPEDFKRWAEGLQKAGLPE